MLNSFAGGKSNSVTYGGGTTLYRVGGKNGGFWSLDPPPATEYQWRVDTAIKQEFCNDASTLYKMTIPEGAKLSGLEGKVGSQGMGLYGGAHHLETLLQGGFVVLRGHAAIQKIPHCRENAIC